MIVTSSVFLVLRQPERRHLQNASLQLQADIQYAQRRAIAEGRKFMIEFTRGSNRYRIMYYCSPRLEIRRIYFQNGVSLYRPSTTFQMWFRPRGTPSHAFTIELHTARYRQDITIVPSGGRADIKEIQRR